MDSASGSASTVSGGASGSSVVDEASEDDEHRSIGDDAQSSTEQAARLLLALLRVGAKHGLVSGVWYAADADLELVQARPEHTMAGWLNLDAGVVQQLVSQAGLLPPTWTARTIQKMLRSTEHGEPDVFVERTRSDGRRTW